ncbi:RHS repeat-associated core domain-containing protein, partial [Paenibacillus ehimensis]|uniref:RHS repeat-associated core domain-containing protein n=1 Tax=Paenibacillus ehimensis TaxID=79264 RepID=UPI0013E341F8
QYEDEETGLYYNRFRYYSPHEGIYTQQDPIGLEGGIRLYGYISDPNIEVDEFGLFANHRRRKNGQFAKKPGPRPKPKPSLHGNSRASNKPAVLYALYNESDEFQKWGITNEVKDLKKRYGNTIPSTWSMDPIDSGARDEILNLERELAEKRPGSLNKESWAGSKLGESLSPRAEKAFKKIRCLP